MNQIGLICSIEKELYESTRRRVVGYFIGIVFVICPKGQGIKPQEIPRI